jgi:hypothetical protein
MINKTKYFASVKTSYILKLLQKIKFLVLNKNLQFIDFYCIIARINLSLRQSSKYFMLESWPLQNERQNIILLQPL